MKALRERAGLSQDKLAKILNKSVSAISKWDQGETFPRFYPSEIDDLISALGCTFTELKEAELNWRQSKKSHDAPLGHLLRPKGAELGGIIPD